MFQQTKAWLLALTLAAAPFGALAFDLDSDTVDDTADNCILTANTPSTRSSYEQPLQEDWNANGVGRECDGDFNEDGIVDASDYALLADSDGAKALIAEITWTGTGTNVTKTICDGSAGTNSEANGTGNDVGHFKVQQAANPPTEIPSSPSPSILIPEYHQRGGQLADSYAIDWTHLEDLDTTCTGNWCGCYTESADWSAGHWLHLRG